MIDGLWKQIFTAVGLDSTKRITIAKNSGGTYNLQKFDSTDTTNRVVTGYFQEMIDNADTLLSDLRDEGLFIIATKSMTDQYRRELKAASAIPSSYEAIINGIKVLTIDGVPIITMSFWDRTIKADFNNGTTTYLPHRAVLTVAENIPVGFDVEQDQSLVENFYLPLEQKNYWREQHNIDTKLLQDVLFMTAY